MKARVQNGVIQVVLSRHNLRALLAQLDDPGRPSPALLTEYNVGDFRALLVVPEENEVHYAGRLPPGRMQPETERRMES